MKKCKNCGYFHRYTVPESYDTEEWCDLGIGEDEFIADRHCDIGCNFLIRLKVKLRIRKELEYFRNEGKREEKDKKIILRKAKKIGGKEFYKDLLAYLEECGSTCHYEIKVCINKGEKIQDEDYCFKKAYICQHTMAGTDDCFYGTISVPINDSQYFSFCFDC